MTTPDSTSWTPGTPERAVANAFAAFNARDADALTRAATPDSVRAYAARHAGESRVHADGSRDSQPIGNGTASSTLEGALKAASKHLTGLIQCAALGHVLEGSAVAHVVFRLLYADRNGVTTVISPEPEIATTQRIDGEWRIVLDEWAIAGLPGFRNAIWFTDLQREDEREG